MRIAFDLTPIYDHLTGIERYNINITKEIIKAHPENDYILLFKNEIHQSFKKITEQDNIKTIIISGHNKLLFIQWKLYKALLSIDADYYIFLSFTSPILFKKSKIINAIHDLTCWDCPESIPGKMKLYYRYTFKVAAKKSWKIVTVSKFSQGRICEKYGLHEKDVPIIYDGLTDIFCVDSNNKSGLKEKYKLPDTYILSLSTIEPRKNLQLLIHVYKEMQQEESMPDLVLAGREGWKLEDIVGNITEDVKKHIHFTGFIDDEDLAQIYREANLFIFPSKYEGFGLPLIEAMSQGTIVICSDAASLPEVAGDVGLLFESNNANSLKEKIKYALKMSEEERDKRRKEGIQLSRRYSWKEEANKLYNIIME